MEILLELRGHDDTVIDSMSPSFEKNAVLKDLKQVIATEWRIPEISQRIFAENKTPIHVLSLETPLESLKDNKKLLVKHALLPPFSTFKELLAKTAKKDDEKRDIAKKLRALKETLDHSGFFNVYPNYFLDVTDEYRENIRCLNYDRAVMEESARRYFGTLNIANFRANTQGSNFGLIFDYHHEGATKVIYFKANEKNWGVNPDARELVIYILLKRIGVGPAECYFVPNTAQTKTVVYIATLQVPEFKEAKLISGSMEEVPAVELHLLSAILYLSDLNLENFGLNKDSSLSIVDFSVGDGRIENTDIAERFKNNVRREPIFEMLDQCPPQRRVKIGKEALNRWNLISAIEHAEEDFLEIKKLTPEVEFLEQASHAIKKYLESVKSNLNQLISSWENES